LGSVGKNVLFGKNLTLRHPHKIFVGSNVVIDDNCLLDAKGSRNRGIWLGDNIVIGRYCSLTCKEGNIVIGANTQISPNVSMTIADGELNIGEYVGIGGGSRLIGANHQLRSEIDEALAPEWMVPSISGGIVLNDRAFMGSNVTVLDGVSIGRNTVVGACSLVSRDLPENVIAMGIPARVTKQRKVKHPEAGDK
jgi:acetyltransferase-like isoleucine patch superfamily enzyme